MLRKVLCSILLICSLNLVGQETVGQFKNSLKTSASNIKDVFPIVDEDNGNIALFIADAKNVYAYKLNERIEVLQELSSQEKLRKYKLLIGSSINSNGDYLIYLSNNSERKFLCVNFSFETQTTLHKEFTFEDRNERMLQTINNNNKFYILSYHNSKDEIYIYTFDESGNATRNQLDFSEFDFISQNSQMVSFKKMALNFGGNSEIQKLNENDPHSIESVAIDRKMYIRDGEVIFTFDQNDSFTQMVTLDLNTLKTNLKIYKKPLFTVSNIEKNSNSYLNGEYLFLLVNTRDEAEMQIMKYKTMEILNTYRIEKDKPIDFKNSPIIQEGGIYARYREMEKTQKFLRKIYQGDVGVSVIQRNNQYEVTLGGFVERNTGGMMVPGYGIPLASAGNVTLFFDPTALAYSSYRATKSTRIECLLDENMSHTEGKIYDNAFDKMDEDPTFSSEAGETVFRYRDFYLKGFYDPKNKLYTFRKYTN